MRTTGHIDIDKPIAQVFDATLEDPSQWSDLIVTRKRLPKNRLRSFRMDDE